MERNTKNNRTSIWKFVNTIKRSSRIPARILGNEYKEYFNSIDIMKAFAVSFSNIGLLTSILQFGDSYSLQIYIMNFPS